MGLYVKDLPGGTTTLRSILYTAREAFRFYFEADNYFVDKNAKLLAQSVQLEELIRLKVLTAKENLVLLDEDAFLRGSHPDIVALRQKQIQFILEKHGVLNATAQLDQYDFSVSERHVEF